MLKNFCFHAYAKKSLSTCRDREKGTILVPFYLLKGTILVPFNRLIGTILVPFNLLKGTKFVPFNLLKGTILVPFNRLKGTKLCSITHMLFQGTKYMSPLEPPAPPPPSQGPS